MASLDEQDGSEYSWIHDDDQEDVYDIQICDIDTLLRALSTRHVMF